jgi:DNA-binding response OmpR family regulator
VPPRFVESFLLRRDLVTVKKSPESTTVLVVDDDKAIRRLVATVLRRHKFMVDTAEDGVEAVLKLGLIEYDLIILDLMMPNLDGFAFVSTLNQSHPEMLQRIIVTSAASPPVIRDRMHGLPVNVLPKPFDLEELLRRVNETLDAIVE